MNLNSMTIRKKIRWKMGDGTRICGCAIYLIFYTLTTLVQNIESDDRMRPAKVACEKYRRIVTELNLPKIQPSDEYMTNSGEFPYMAAVGFLFTRPGNDGASKYNRAGVLISEKHVLSTGFAISTFHGRIPVEVILGTLDPRDPNENQHSQRYRISRIIWHPQFERKYEYNNVAILELKAPVRFTPYVQPVCLMTEPLTVDTKGANTSLVINTWTSNYWDDLIKPSTQIKIAGQRLVEKAECSDFYGSWLPRIPNGLGGDMICLKKKNNRSRDSCLGRTSAPVLIPSKEYFLLVGITTFHFQCPSPEPSVAVSIYQHLNWIERQVWPDM